jgi:hypothetical protein
MAGRVLRAAAILLGLAPAGCGGGSGDPCAGVQCSWRGFCIADQGNADGYSDLAVGAEAQGSGRQGYAFVYEGSASGIPDAPTVTIDNPGNQSLSHFGYCVARAGPYGAARPCA